MDPRTGEILDADIEVNENITRVYSGRAAEDPPRPIGGQAIGAVDPAVVELRACMPTRSSPKPRLRWTCCLPAVNWCREAPRPNSL